MVEIGTIVSKRLSLRQFTDADITPAYLSWLNDSEVNAYSRRAGTTTDAEGARAYLRSLHKDEVNLAICLKDAKKHIGNIKFGPVDWDNKLADISILIGDRDEWNKGYAGEAIYVLTKYLFEVLGLNRVEAGTINPAFSRCVAKLGWKEEGVVRQGFFLHGDFHDVVRLSLLRSEFIMIPKYEDDADGSDI